MILGTIAEIIPETIHEAIDNYDWEQAFTYAGAPTKITATAVMDGTDKGFTREDVRAILHIKDGENDGPCWIGVFLLRDGRYAFLQAAVITPDGIVRQAGAHGSRHPTNCS